MVADKIVEVFDMCIKQAYHIAFVVYTIIGLRNGVSLFTDTPL